MALLPAAEVLVMREVEQLIAEAIPLHIQSLREHGEPVPPPTAMGDCDRASGP